MSAIKISLNTSIKQLKELRFILCPISQNSLGTRKWIKNNFINESTNNPEIQFIVRESEGADTLVLARFSKYFFDLI